MKLFFALALGIMMPLLAMPGAAIAVEIPSDAWMQSRIDAEYQLSGILNRFDLDAQVKDGVAELSGYVTSRREKELAEQIARNIEGVAGVLNKITIDAERARKLDPSDPVTSAEPYSRRIDNYSDTARMKAQVFLKTPALTEDIDIDTRSGTVFLGGAVKTEEIRSKVIEIVRQHAGSRNIQENLIVGESIS